MDGREILINAINSALAAQIISQEDLLEICCKDGCSVRDYSQAKRIEEEVVDYLNSVEAVSLNNFTNVMNNRGIKIRYKRTLERCLARGCFEYKQKIKGRTYYVKTGRSKPVTKEEVVHGKSKDMGIG